MKKKEGLVGEVQPEPISLKAARDMAKSASRAAFNKQINKIKRYLRKGAEMPYTTKEGVNITLYEKKEIDIAFRTINARRKAQIEKYQPSTFKGTMGTIEANNLKPRKNTIQSIKPKNWDKFVHGLEAQLMGEQDEVRQEKYKQNFITAIRNVFGENTELEQKISKIDAQKLTELYYSNPLLQIGFVYDPKEAQELQDVMVEQIDNLQ